MPADLNPLHYVAPIGTEPDDAQLMSLPNATPETAPLASAVPVSGSVGEYAAAVQAAANRAPAYTPGQVNGAYRTAEPGAAQEAMQAPAPMPPAGPVPGSQDWLTQAQREMYLRAAQQAATGYAPTRVKGGDFVTGYTTQTAPQVSDEEILRRREGVDTLAGLLREGEAAGEAQRNQEARSAWNVAAKTSDQAAELSRRQVQTDAEIERRLGEANRLREQAVAQSVQTPSEIWSERGTGAKVVGALAEMFDTIGSTLTGTEPTVGKQMRQDIQDEIQAQHAKKRALGLDADAVLNSADAYAQLYGTPEAQDKARMAVSMDAVVAQARAMGAEMGIDPATIDQRLKDFGILDQQQRANADAEAAMVSGVTQTQHAVTQDRYVGGKAPDYAKAAELMGKAGAGGQSLGEGEQRANANRVIVDGQQLFAKDATQAGQLQDYFTSSEKVQRYARQIRENLDRWGSLPTEARAKLEVDTNSLLLALKDSAKLGVMSDSDKQIVEAMSGMGATKIFSRDASTRAALDQVLANTANERRDNMAVLSRRPGSYESATGGIQFQAPVR